MSYSLNDHITFSAGGAALDRASHLRADWAALLAGGEAQVLPMAHGRTLIDLDGGTPETMLVPPADARLDAARESPVLLGLYQDRPVFAADYSGLDEAAAAALFPAGKFIDLRSIAGELSPGAATLAAVAKGVLGWHESHPCCARCGAPSLPEDGGWRRRCGLCGALHFPRTDPVVIMLILHDEHVLLGRQAGWPEGILSLLAGFMEPGETIEEAVRREVREEAAIEVAEVGYLGCQPWPFPTTLMIGCIGRATTREIVRDPTELEEARWVSRAEMAEVLAGRHDTIRAPRLDAIARTIVEAWVDGKVGLG